MFEDDLLVRSRNGFELTLRGRKILAELEVLLPKMEHLVTPNLFDPMRAKSHFRISGPDNVCTACVGSTATDFTKCSLNSCLGRLAFRNWWNVGNSTLFLTLMTGFCRCTFTQRDSIGR